MWIPHNVFELFRISKESVEALREELAATRAERDALKSQLLVSTNHMEWIRTRINVLEVERAQLIEKAYGIKAPIPEIVRQPQFTPELNATLFDDVGEVAAKALGLPVYA